MDINKPNSASNPAIAKSVNDHQSSVSPRFQTPFLGHLNAFLENNFSSLDLSNAHIAHHLGLSNRQLYRNVDKSLGLTPNQYITKFRMQKAKTLLNSRKYFTAKEVALLVGYKKSSYFSQLFKEEFQETPFEFLRRIGIRQSQNLGNS